MIHPQSGTRVYYDRHGDATLFAYHRLLTHYLVLVYKRGAASYALASFAEILDALPIESVPLAGVRLTLEATLEATVEAWLSSARRVLRLRCGE